jgi:hypothetical protein
MMSDTKAGKDIGELSREELLKLVRYLMKQVEELSGPEAVRARKLGRVEQIKLGEKY